MGFSNQPIGAVAPPCPSDDKRPVYWVEIELVGEDNKPIPWEQYSVTLPEGKVVSGYLDDTGFARLDGLTSSGTCQITFPDLDKDAWDKVAVLPQRAT